MLDMFLEAAYDTSRKEQEKRAFIDNLKKLPMRELIGLANGEIKLAGCCGNDLEWLEKFKGTPLFDQAMQLEQQEIQGDIARQQKSQANQSEYAATDQIRLQKRLLELQLVQMQAQAEGGGPAGPPAPGAMAAAPPDAQGAGAPGMDTGVISPGGDTGGPIKSAGAVGHHLATKRKEAAASGRIQGFGAGVKGALKSVKDNPVKSMAAAGAVGAAAGAAGHHLATKKSEKPEDTKESSVDLSAAAKRWGQELAQADAFKLAHFRTLEEGAKLAAPAGFLSGLGKQVGGIVNKSFGKGTTALMGNRALMGAGIGAAGGALAGGLTADEGQGMSGALKGGLGGAALGGLAGGGSALLGKPISAAQKAMKGGATPLGAIGAGAQDLYTRGGKAVGGVQKAMGY